MMLNAFAVLLAVVMMATVEYLSLGRLGHELENSTGSIARQLQLAGNLKAGANGMRTGQRGILLNALQHDAAGVDATRKDYEARRAGVQGLLQELRPMLTESHSADLADSLQAGAEQHAAC